MGFSGSIKLNRSVSKLPTFFKDAPAFRYNEDFAFCPEGTQAIVYSLTEDACVQVLEMSRSIPAIMLTSLFQNRYIHAVGNSTYFGYDIQEKTSITFEHRPQEVGIRTKGSWSVCDSAGIFLMGGENNHNCFLSKVEYMKWGRPFRRLQPLNTRRRDAAATVLPNGRLVVVGGLAGDPRDPHESGETEVYLPELNQWDSGPALCVPRSMHTCVTLGDLVVVIGGCTRCGGLVYEIEAWNYKASADFVVIGLLERPRKKFSAVTFGVNRIKIFGGHCSEVDNLIIDPKLIQALSNEAIPSCHPHAVAEDDPSATQKAERPSESCKVSQASSSNVPRGNGIVSLIPHLPPTPLLPVLPPSTTVRQRRNALKQHVLHLTETRSKFEGMVNQTIDRVKEVYQRACNDEVAHILSRTETWYDSVDQQIKSTREELQEQKAFLARKKVQDACVWSLLYDNDKDDFEDSIPSSLRCPITLALMKDPVVAADGNTYERAALEHWIKSKKGSAKIPSPLSGAMLESRKFYPVHSLKLLCTQYANAMQQTKETKVSED